MGLTEQFVLFMCVGFIVADLQQSLNSNADPTNCNISESCVLENCTIGSAFKGTGNCRSLHLYHVTITESSKEMFARILDGIDSLHMTDVGLKAMDLLQNLELLCIDVQYGRPTKITINQNTTYKLETLILTKIPQLPANIEKLRSLKHFDIRHIYVANVDLAILTTMTHLEEIYIQSSKVITAVDPVLLPSLVRLAIEDSPISFSNAASCELPQLEVLQLRNNSLVAIPKQFSKFKSLTYITIVFNNLRRVTLDAFADMKQLECIRLMDNHIAELTTVSKLELSQLHSLEINRNKLTHLDATLWVMPALKELNLDRNQLKQMTGLPDLMSSKLLTVLLNENPWDCEWLVETVPKLPGMQIIILGDICTLYRV